MRFDRITSQPSIQELPTNDQKTLTSSGADSLDPTRPGAASFSKVNQANVPLELQAAILLMLILELT